MVTEDSPKRKKSWAFLWVALAVILAALAVGVLWWWKAGRPVASGACNPGDLSLSVGQTQGAAGTEYVHAVLTNASTRTCTLNGYPTASMLDKTGAVLLASAQQNNLYTASMVTLAPHDQANAVLAFPNADNFDAHVCSDTSVTLRLYLPGAAVTSSGLTTSLARKVCPGFSATALQPGA